MINKIRAYITGNIRYYLYYNPKLKWIIRNHIYYQIEARISSMDRQCYNDGSCKLCGCTTTALQMANKECDKPCYPKMMNKKEWEFFKKGKTVNYRHSMKVAGWTYIQTNKFQKI